MHIAKVQNHHALKFLTLVHPYTPNMTEQKQQMISYNSSFHYRGIETKGKLGSVSIWVSIDDHNYIHDERDIWKFSFPKQYLEFLWTSGCIWVSITF